MMGDSISERITRLNGALDNLQNQASEAGMLVIEKRIQENQRIKEALAKLDRQYRVVELEVRTLPAEEKLAWNQELKNLKFKFANVKTELNWAKTADEAVEEMKEMNEHTPEATEADVIKSGEETIIHINESTKVTLEMIAQAEDLAVKTALKLKEQGEQLGTIDADLYEIEDTLARATAITRRMARRVLTDKYVWVLLVLIVLALMGVVALKVTGHSITGNTNGF
eukprot:TRINITY_DN978_c0_g1_i1.p1 TRINITY_DN978_c0_g1~~TRINITY_DN978_c0_g1_i1.p1  ORF type:complete len:226 (+),score=84.80 TRINITY_DN978_c0_g1_i1:62-739(+)